MCPREFYAIDIRLLEYPSIRVYMQYTPLPILLLPHMLATVTNTLVTPSYILPIIIAFFVRFVFVVVVIAVDVYNCVLRLNYLVAAVAENDILMKCSKFSCRCFYCYWRFFSFRSIRLFAARRHICWLNENLNTSLYNYTLGHM